jgi:hypothetical protein
MAGAVMDKVGYLSLRPEIMQAGIVLQALSNSFIEVGDSEYLGQ